MSRCLIKTIDFFLILLKRIDGRMNIIFGNRRTEKKAWFLFILILFSAVLLLNMLTPLIADDYSYKLIFGTDDYVGSIRDILTSQINHYKEWGGRSVVHFIAQVLLLLPPWVADILNTLIYLLFSALIYIHVKGRKKHKLSLFILITLSVWFFLPMLGDTVFWITGSANYLWGTTIILLFLLPYRLYRGDVKSRSNDIAIALVFFIGGIITGWTNENTVAGLICILVALFFFFISQKWKIRISHLMGLLGVLLGYTAMIMAPGNLKRGGEALGLDLFAIIYRIFSYTQTLFVDYGFLILIYFIGFILVLRGERNKKNELALSVIYLLGAIVAIYAMILSPQFPARAWFGLITYVVIAIGLLFNQLNFELPLMKSIRNVCILVGISIFAFSYLSASKDIYKMYEIDKKRLIQAQEAKKRGAKECTFEMNSPQTKYLHAEDINGNHLLVRFYGIHIEYK